VSLPKSKNNEEPRLANQTEIILKRFDAYLDFLRSSNIFIADKNAGTVKNASTQEYGTAAASEYQNMIQKGDKGFFLESGILYGYSHFSPDPLIENNGVNVLFGLGYDFGKVELALNFDVGLAHKIKYTGWGYGSAVKIDEWTDAGIDLNAGIKIYNGQVFDFIVPLGLMWDMIN
jgi:hypothetical protein